MKTNKLLLTFAFVSTCSWSMATKAEEAPVAEAASAADAAAAADVAKNADATNYSQCELENLSLTTDASLTATLKCLTKDVDSYSDSEKTAFWIKDEGGFMPPPLPPGCPEEQKNTLKTTARSMIAVAGHCVKVPVSTTVKVVGIEKNQTFWFMAFKDNMILKNVKVITSTGVMISADLALGKKGDTRFNVNIPRVGRSGGGADGAAVDCARAIVGFNAQLQDMTATKNTCGN